MNWYKIAQIAQIEQQTESNLGGPSINIYPYDPILKETIDELQRESPGFFDNITDVVVDVGFGQFGSVSSLSPNTIYINLNKAKDQLNQTPNLPQSGSVEYKEALKNTIKEILIHERAHVLDYDAKTNTFPGGEMPAEQATRQYFNY